MCPPIGCPASVPWLINRDVRSSDLALPRGVSGASDEIGLYCTDDLKKAILLGSG